MWQHSASNSAAQHDTSHHISNVQQEGDAVMHACMPHMPLRQALAALGSRQICSCCIMCYRATASVKIRIKDVPTHPPSTQPDATFGATTNSGWRSQIKLGSPACVQSLCGLRHSQTAHTNNASTRGTIGTYYAPGQCHRDGVVG